MDIKNYKPKGDKKNSDYFNEYLIKINSSKNIIQEFLYVETDISIKYLLYIEKYGIPLDGIFDSEKLKTIILDDYSKIIN